MLHAHIKSFPVTFCHLHIHDRLSGTKHENSKNQDQISWSWADHKQGEMGPALTSAIDFFSPLAINLNVKYHKLKWHINQTLYYYQSCSKINLCWVFIYWFSCRDGSLFFFKNENIYSKLKNLDSDSSRQKVSNFLLLGEFLFFTFLLTTWSRKRKHFLAGGVLWLWLVSESLREGYHKSNYRLYERLCIKLSIFEEARFQKQTLQNQSQLTFMHWSPHWWFPSKGQPLISLHHFRT